MPCDRLHCAAQTFGILFGDDDRELQQVCGLHQQRNAFSKLAKVGNDFGECLLHINHCQRRAVTIKQGRMPDGHGFFPQFTVTGLAVPKERSRAGCASVVNASNTNTIQIKSESSKWMICKKMGACNNRFANPATIWNSINATSATENLLAHMPPRQDRAKSAVRINSVPTPAAMKG